MLQIPNFSNFPAIYMKNIFSLNCIYIFFALENNTLCSSQMSNGTGVDQLKLRYFDHLLQAYITAVATCDSAATPLQRAAPLVRCTDSEITVKLPLGTRLQRVKALGKGGMVGKVPTTKTPGGELVRISTAVDMVRMP